MMYWIFHHNDMDGYFSKQIIKKSLPTDDVKTVEINYGPEVEQKLALPKQGDIVYIVDYSFTRDTMKQLDILIENVGIENIIWIDHHISSLNLIKEKPIYGRIAGLRSVSHCGAWYCWEYTESTTTMPDVIRYVSDYDCWQQQMKPQCDYLNASFWGSEDKDAFVILLLNREVELTHVFEIGEIIYKADVIAKARICKKIGYESELEGVKCFCVNNNGSSTCFTDEILNKYDMVVLWNFNGTEYDYSLYSQNGFDTSKIAEKFGGGGHPGASGFSANKLLVVKRSEE